MRRQRLTTKGRSPRDSWPSVGRRYATLKLLIKATGVVRPSLADALQNCPRARCPRVISPRGRALSDKRHPAPRLRGPIIASTFLRTPRPPPRARGRRVTNRIIYERNRVRAALEGLLARSASPRLRVGCAIRSRCEDRHGAVSNAQRHASRTAAPLHPDGLGGRRTLLAATSRRRARGPRGLRVRHQPRLQRREGRLLSSSSAPVGGRTLDSSRHAGLILLSSLALMVVGSSGASSPWGALAQDNRSVLKA